VYTTQRHSIWHALVILFVLIPVRALAADAPYGFYTGEYVKATDNLNVRSGAGTSYSVLMTVHDGVPGIVRGGPRTTTATNGGVSSTRHST